MVAPNLLLKVKVLVVQWSPSLCHPVDYSPQGSSVHGILQARILTGVGCHFLLQGIFLTQGSNPGLLHCGQILYHLSHQQSPKSSVRSTEMLDNIWNHFDIKHLTLLVIVSTSGLFPCTPCEFRLGLYSLELNLWNVFEAWVKATFLWRGFVFVVLGTWVPSTRNYLKFSLGDFQTTQGLKSVWRPSPGYDSLGEIIFLLGAVKGSPLVHAV